MIGNNIVRTDINLFRKPISTKTIVVESTFKNQRRSLAFPSTSSIFTFNVVAVNVAPSIEFVGANSLVIPVQTIPNVSPKTLDFKVNNPENTILTTDFSIGSGSKFSNIFAVVLVRTNHFQVRLIETPATRNIQPGQYATFTIRYQNLIANFTVSFTADKDVSNTGSNSDSAASKPNINSDDSAAMVGPILGAIGGLVVILLIIALVVNRNKKKRLVAIVLDEPLYAANALSNPMHAVMFSASLDSTYDVKHSEVAAQYIPVDNFIPGMKVITLFAYLMSSFHIVTLSSVISRICIYIYYYF